MTFNWAPREGGTLVLVSKVCCDRHRSTTTQSFVSWNSHKALLEVFLSIFTPMCLLTQITCSCHLLYCIRGCYSPILVAPLPMDSWKCRLMSGRIAWSRMGPFTSCFLFSPAGWACGYVVPRQLQQQLKKFQLRRLVMKVPKKSWKEWQWGEEVMAQHSRAGKPLPLQRWQPEACTPWQLVHNGWW